MEARTTTRTRARLHDALPPHARWKKALMQSAPEADCVRETARLVIERQGGLAGLDDVLVSPHSVAGRVLQGFCSAFHGTATAGRASAARTQSQDTPNPGTHPIPGQAHYQDTLNPTTHPIPGQAHYQDTPNPGTHPIPGQAHYQDTPNPTTHPIPRHKLDDYARNEEEEMDMIYKALQDSQREANDAAGIARGSGLLSSGARTDTVPPADAALSSQNPKKGQQPSEDVKTGFTYIPRSDLLAGIYKQNKKTLSKPPREVGLTITVDGKTYKSVKSVGGEFDRSPLIWVQTGDLKPGLDFKNLKLKELIDEEEAAESALASQLLEDRSSSKVGPLGSQLLAARSRLSPYEVEVGPSAIQSQDTPNPTTRPIPGHTQSQDRLHPRTHPPGTVAPAPASRDMSSASSDGSSGYTLTDMPAQA